LHHDHDHEVLQHSAHLHGHAELTLALEGRALEINLASPAANIVGFEHKATSSEQLRGGAVLVFRGRLLLKANKGGCVCLNTG